MGKIRKFSFEERRKIEERLQQNISIPKIALELNRDRSAINKEVKRCEGTYNAEKAQSTVIKGFSPIDFTIIGKKFGMLTIKDYVGIQNHRTWWKATCECGNETRISRKTLVDKMSAKNPFNCGCLGKQKAYQKESEIEESMLSKYHHLMNLIELSHDCWFWKGYINKTTKVPMTSFNNKVRSVRRMFYEILYPEFNESTKWVYASCGDRNCVNPDHIVEGRPKKDHYFN